MANKITQCVQVAQPSSLTIWPSEHTRPASAAFVGLLPLYCLLMNIWLTL